VGKNLMSVLIDKIGKQFGLLTVIDRLPNDLTKQSVWLCECKCGKKTSVRASNLHSGNTTSCGCYHKKLMSKRPYEHNYNRLLASAKRRRWKCEITYDDFIQFTKIKQCYYCNDKIHWNKHVIQHVSQSYKIDRLDSKIGYVKNNCVVCCGKCNLMKGKLDKDEFISQCNKIAYKL
jgi:hypothetical protein